MFGLGSMAPPYTNQISFDISPLSFSMLLCYFNFCLSEPSGLDLQHKKVLAVHVTKSKKKIKQTQTQTQPP